MIPQEAEPATAMERGTHGGSCLPSQDLEDGGTKTAISLIYMMSLRPAWAKRRFQDQPELQSLKPT